MWLRLLLIVNDKFCEIANTGGQVRALVGRWTISSSILLDLLPHNHMVHFFFEGLNLVSWGMLPQDLLLLHKLVNQLLVLLVLNGLARSDGQALRLAPGEMLL